MTNIYRAVAGGLTVPQLARPRRGGKYLSRVLLPGDEITVSDELVDAYPQFGDLSDAAQIKNFGRVFVAPVE